MSYLATFSADSGLQAAVRAVLPRGWPVAQTGSWSRLLRLVHERPITCVILDDASLYRARGLASAVAELRARYPSVAKVVVARPGSDPHALLRLGRARLESLMLIPQDLLEYQLPQEVGSALRHGTVALVTRALSPYLPVRESTALRGALEGAQWGWSAEELAANVGLTRPHLSVRLKEAGLPSAGQTLVWARLLHAGRWLADPGRSAESVSRQLEYSSGAAFRRALKNYTGATPTEVVEGGGFFFVLDRFLADCSLSRRRVLGRSAA